MRLIAIIQKIAVKAVIHARLSTSVFVMSGRVSIRMMATRWVRGKKISAKYCKATGRRLSGKKVPENNAMGVMNRNDG